PAVLQRPAGQHVDRRPAPARRRAQRPLPRGGGQLHAAPPREARHHRLGPGQRTARRNRHRRQDGRARRVRPVLPAELVAAVRPAHRCADRVQGPHWPQCLLTWLFIKLGYLIVNVERKIAVVGLGYVGLPLAVEFGKHFRTLGFDIDRARVEELANGHDRTRETAPDELTSAELLAFTTDESRLAECNVYIVTVPTPVDEANRPDLSPLEKASVTLGRYLNVGDIVVYESTVYPGTTEEVCVPILEKTSGLKFNLDFFCGYSPERINPGDKQHRLANIKKITSGST